jgi:hypothetical protein
MQPELLNDNVRNTQYAVRGELYLKARGCASADGALGAVASRCAAAPYRGR